MNFMHGYGTFLGVTLATVAGGGGGSLDKREGLITDGVVTGSGRRGPGLDRVLYNDSSRASA
jgi:hypothetical protein